MLYEALLRNVILPTGGLFFGQRMMRRLRFLEKAQYFPLEELNHQSDSELQSLLKLVYNQVPMYKDLYNKVGIDIDKIKTKEDLKQFPIITKDILRENFPAKSTLKTGHPVHKVVTSGSTGKRIELYEDTYTTGWYQASFLLSLEWSGWRFGDSHIQTGMSINRGFKKELKDLLLRCNYFYSYDLVASSLDKIIKKMLDKKIRFLWGYPSSLFSIAMRARELGITHELKAISTWGATLTERYRDILEKTFNCKVFDTYGISEGMQIAAQCEYGNYHIHCLDTIIEIVDEQGVQVKPGEVGKVLLTRLLPGATPLIRYDVGDLAIPSSKQSCQCGRTLPLLRGVYGRTSDLIITPDGNRLYAHFFAGVIETFDCILNYQIHQFKKGEIVILLVIDKNKNYDEKKFINTVKESGAGNLKIDVEIVPDIPLASTGKHQLVINHLKELD